MLEGKVALVAGATRGAGRAIAVELAKAGATVYATGRSTRAGRSVMDRPETIEETAELAGPTATAVRVDHSRPAEVAALLERIEAEQGRLDVLVNDVWGGDPLTQWDTPLWEHDLDAGLRLLHNAIDTHVITSWHALPLMLRTPGGLVIEITDGVGAHYRGSFFYDLAKNGVIRLAVAQAAELEPRGLTALALTPGFIRSEAMLDHFGVTEDNWREAPSKHFLQSETPAFVARAVVALASDPDRGRYSGRALSSWELAREHGFTDADGARPDWGAYAEASGLPQ